MEQRRAREGGVGSKVKRGRSRGEGVLYVSYVCMRRDTMYVICHMLCVSIEVTVSVHTS